MTIDDHKNSILGDIPTVTDLVVSISNRLDQVFSKEYLDQLLVPIGNISTQGLEETNQQLASLQAYKDSCLVTVENVSLLKLELAQIVSSLEEAIEVLKAAHFQDIKNLKSDNLRITYLRSVYPQFFRLYSLSNKLLDKVEHCYKVSQHYMENLDSANKNLSRQITAMQLMLSTGEIRYNSNPTVTKGA